MMRSFEAGLPTEQWQQVLENVTRGDLCNVTLTSKHMNSVASWPDLWAGMKVNVRKVRVNGLAQLYSISRFNKVKEINFRGMKLTCVELERILSDIPGSPLENINFGGINISEVSPELLATVVGHLKTLNLSSTSLTADQCVRVLEACLSSTTVVNVDLYLVDISAVPANLLAKAVCRLPAANLSSNRLTVGHCVKVLEESLSSTTLVNVDWSHVDLSEVPPNLLAKSVSRLQDLNLSSTKLTTDQWVQVLEASISSTLVNVNLSWSDLSGVPPNLLATAVSRLRAVNFSCTNVTVDQCVKVLEASLSSTSLVHVHLNSVDLSEVPPNLLGRAVTRLQTINLSYTRLTVDQCVQVLTDITSSTTLTNVSLKYINLQGVPPNLLAMAVSCLQTVNLLGTGLTATQCDKVLETSLLSSTLVNLNLRFVNLSRVPADLLARAVARLQTVDLHGTSLTVDQCVHVLEASLSSTTLVNVDLSNLNLSGVAPNLLAKAVSHLITVNLSSFNKVRTEQCVQVLEASLSSATLVNVNLTHITLRGVPANLLAMAVGRLESVNLSSTKLTTDQTVQVLKAITASTTLSRVKMIGNHIRGTLPPGLQYLLTSLPAYVQV